MAGGKVSPEHMDDVLGRMEAMLQKIGMLKQAGRRASLAGAEMDLMRLVQETCEIMQATLQSSSNHHELLVKIFGGDFIRISRSRSILDHVTFSDMYRTGKQVQEGLAECKAVEDVLKDLGYHVILAQVQAKENLELLQRLGHASEEELEAARAKHEAATGVPPAEAPKAEVQQVVEQKEVKVNGATEKPAKIAAEQAPKQDQGQQPGKEEQKEAKREEVKEVPKTAKTEQAAAVAAAPGAGAQPEEAGLQADAPAEEPRTARPVEPEAAAAAAPVPAPAEAPAPAPALAAAPAPEAEAPQPLASAEEEERRAKEAREKIEEAKKVRALPKLGTEESLELKEVALRGTVELVHHTAPDSVPHPEPAPGMRFVVVAHPALVGRHGTLVGPVAASGGPGRWTGLLDAGQGRVELEASQFETAPAPLGQLSFKEPIDFHGVKHGDPPVADYKDEKKAMALLTDAARVLQAYSGAIVSIEGHTGTPDERMDDWAHALAQGRAEKIKAAFVSLGIDEGRLKPVGLPGRLGGRKHDVVLKMVSL